MNYGHNCTAFFIYRCECIVFCCSPVHGILVMCTLRVFFWRMDLCTLCEVIVSIAYPVRDSWKFFCYASIFHLYSITHSNEPWDSQRASIHRRINWPHCNRNSLNEGERNIGMLYRLLGSWYIYLVRQHTSISMHTYTAYYTYTELSLRKAMTLRWKFKQVYMPVQWASAV